MWGEVLALIVNLNFFKMCWIFFPLLKYQRDGDILHFSLDESTRYVQNIPDSLLFWLVAMTHSSNSGENRSKFPVLGPLPGSAGMFCARRPWSRHSPCHILSGYGAVYWNPSGCFLPGPQSDWLVCTFPALPWFQMSPSCYHLSIFSDRPALRASPLKGPFSLGSG